MAFSRLSRTILALMALPVAVIGSPACAGTTPSSNPGQSPPAAASSPVPAASPAAASSAASPSAVAAAGQGQAVQSPAAQPRGAAVVKPAAMTPIKVAVAGGIAAGTINWDVMVADAQGLFTGNNLQPEFIDTSGGPDTVQAVVSGSADFGVGATDAIIRGGSKGAQISMIAAGAYPPHALATAPSINSYEELRGKRIAVTSITAGSSLLLLELLRAHGLGEQDFEFVLSGNTPQRLAALTAGAAQGTVLSPPEDSTALKQGYKVLGYVSEAAHFIFIGHSVTKAYADKNRPAVVAYARSIRDANRFLLDPANRAAAVAALMKYTNAPQDNAEAAYDTVITKLKGFPKDALPTPEGLDGMVKIVERTDNLSGLKPETFIDASYLKEAGE